MVRQLVAVLAFAIAAPLAAAPGGKPTDEIAADLAYGYCPLYLAGAFSFTNNATLTGMGFGGTPERLRDDRLGDVERLSLSRADGKIDLTGVPQTACNVVVTGTAGDATMARFRKSMALMGLPFQRVQGASPAPRVAAAVETYKARMAASSVLYVQLIRTTKPVAGVAAQLFAKGE